jgi:hypothetical protein
LFLGEAASVMEMEMEQEEEVCPRFSFAFWGLSVLLREKTKADDAA